MLTPPCKAPNTPPLEPSPDLPALLRSGSRLLAEAAVAGARQEHLREVVAEAALVRSPNRFPSPSPAGQPTPSPLAQQASARPASPAPTAEPLLLPDRASPFKSSAGSAAELEALVQPAVVRQGVVQEEASVHQERQAIVGSEKHQPTSAAVPEVEQEMPQEPTVVQEVVQADTAAVQEELTRQVRLAVAAEHQRYMVRVGPEEPVGQPASSLHRLHTVPLVVVEEEQPPERKPAAAAGLPATS